MIIKFGICAWVKKQRFIRGNQCCSSFFYRASSLQKDINMAEQEINSIFAILRLCREVFTLPHQTILNFFFGPLNAYVVLFTPVWKRDRQSSVGWERGRGGGGGGGCQGEIIEENASEREQIVIKQISLFAWYMDAQTITTTLHVFFPVFWHKCS